MQELEIFGERDRLGVRLDADLAPHPGDRLRQLEIVGEHALGCVEADAGGSVRAKARLTDQRRGFRRIVGEMEILRIGRRAVRGGDIDRQGVAGKQRARDRLLVDW